MTHRALATLLLCLASSAFAQGPDPGMKVEKVYETYCASCHGDKFQGGQGGVLVDGEWKHGGTDADITRSIARGNLQLGMTPWEGTLTPEQIRAMVVFLREKEKEFAGKKIEHPKPEPGRVTRTQRHDYTIEMVADGLNIPWAVAFPPGGEILLTERPGKLWVIGADGKRREEPVQGTPEVIHHGQGGLMDVAVHPDHVKNGWVYLALADGWRDGNDPRTLTAIVRGRIRDNRWTDQEWIFKADRRFYTGAGVHFGSRIVFRNGYVAFVVGERGGWKEAQDLTRPNGKIYRLFDDGRVPPDNPFNGVKDAIPGIWSYGHRNPQGLVFDPRNGDLYATEHGPRGGDELNLIRKGANYGWPEITYGMNYDGTPITSQTAKEGMEQPVLHWTPSIAACGLAVVTGDKFPQWRNDLLAGALKQEEVRRVRVVDRKAVEDEVILKNIGRVRDVKVSPDGFIYVVLNDPHRVIRLVPAPR